MVNWEKMNKDLNITDPSYRYATPTVTTALGSKIGKKTIANVF